MESTIFNVAWLSQCQFPIFDFDIVRVVLKRDGVDLQNADT